MVEPFGEPNPFVIGLPGFGPPTIGSSGSGWIWLPEQRRWDRWDQPFGFEARVTAETVRVDPVEVLVGVILLGVINDAGGLIALGGHPIPVPSLGPVEVLGALPTELAQRLAPILEGALPGFAEAVTPLCRQLHRRLSHAIAEYQEESDG
jgi:hypothetical protein